MTLVAIFPDYVTSCEDRAALKIPSSPAVSWETSHLHRVHERDFAGEQGKHHNSQMQWTQHEEQHLLHQHRKSVNFSICHNAWTLPTWVNTVIIDFTGWFERTIDNVLQW